MSRLNPKSDNGSDSWQRMILKDRPRAAWLAEGAPDQDVVLSTRARLARNLRGEKFTTTASSDELKGVMDRLLSAAAELSIKPAFPDLEVFKGLTITERDFLVGARLVSPDFPWTLPGRALLLDQRQILSLMINEEDHLRAQALTPGWTIRVAQKEVVQIVSGLETKLEFARHPDFGYLGASIYNSGQGQRLSAMLHLIGLAHSDRLHDLIGALNQSQITIRGLFGESSRAIGAFAQVSQVNGGIESFEGVCRYLIDQERAAREQIGTKVLKEKAVQALDYVQSSPRLTLAGAVRSLGWMRWASSAQISGFPASVRTLDFALTSLDLRLIGTEEEASAERAIALRKMIL